MQYADFDATSSDAIIFKRKENIFKKKESLLA